MNMGIFIRASGILAFLCLITTPIIIKLGGKIKLHEFIGLLTVIFAVIHLILIMLQAYLG